MFAEDLAPFDLLDIEAGLCSLGTRPQGEYETSFPGTVKLIKAVRAAKVVRTQSSNNVWGPCGQCKDCKDPKLDVLQFGMVHIRDAKGNTSVRVARSQCHDAWRRSQFIE